MELVFNATKIADAIGGDKNEILFEEFTGIQKSDGTNPNDPKFEYFKKKILEHLAELEKKENKTIAKAIDICEYIQKSKFPVGTIRNWNGGKFKKVSSDKWVRVYDKESRGARLAIAVLKRKAAACKDSEQLLQLCLGNMERFRDKNGYPLPFMQEFSAYVSELNDKLESKNTKTESKGKTIETNSFDRIKAAFATKTTAEIEQNIKYLQRNAKADNSMTVSLVESEYMPIKDAIKTLKDILKDKKAVNSDNPKKLTTATKEEVKQFLSDTIDTTKDRRISLGEVSESAKKRIKDKTGKDVNRIILDSGEIRHAMKKTAHNIELSDLERIGEIVNSTNDITLEDKKHQNNDVIRFVEEVDNGINLIMEFRAKKGDLSLVTAYRERRADAPMKNPGQTSETLRTSNSSIPQKEEKSSDKKGIESIRNKYQSSKSIEGDEDEIYVGKEVIPGKWKLVEADAPSASHDEITFKRTEGFPEAESGGTVNDRDYEHDTAAQEMVLEIASDFDGRALGVDSPIVVTQDGVVTSGNNRTLSSKLAARKGTDATYIAALKKRAKKFGFTAEDVAQFEHPRVVFETEHKGEYTTKEFAKYNESGKKAMNPVEKAVKVSKIIKPQTVEEIAETISEFDTMGDLYADRKASQGIFNTLIQNDIIQKGDLPQYFSDGTVTAAGKEFLETVLVGSVMDENNIRQLNTEGGKSVRQKLVRAITPLIENKGMKGYSINKELNEAVGIAIEVAHNKDKFPDVESFSQQQDIFRKLDPVSVELAKKLEGTQKSFAEFMQTMNGGLRPAANGEADIFLGGTESKEDIVNRVLSIKKSVQKALRNFFNHFFDR